MIQSILSIMLIYMVAVLGRGISITINSILKDRYGYLWFATLEGVDRFNGKDTKTYHFNTGRAPAFQSNEVDALYEDHSGNLWVGTMGGGLYRYDRLSDQFRPYP